MKKFCFTLIFLVSFIFYQETFVMASEDTVDLSGLLPQGGTFSNGTMGWFLQLSNLGTIATSTVVTGSDGTDSWIGLRCYGGYTSCEAAIIPQVLNIATSATLDLSTINFAQLQIRIHARGNPVTTYGSSTLWGVFQPQIYPVYWQNPGPPLIPGISPGYLIGNSFNTVNALSIDSFAIAIGCIPTWTWFSFRFNIIAQDFFRVGFFEVPYSAGRHSTVPPYTSELQIDQIKLEGIRFR